MPPEQENAHSIPGYELVEVLGQGGFGIVHLARQVAVGRDVALKIDNRVLGTDRDRRRFMREVTSAGRLSGHPHVVSVYDAGVFDDGRPYMVLELCPNGSLADRLRDEGPLPAAEVRDIGVHIADALAAAHAIGVLHRDVKPANILINQYGSVALADFGLATMPSPGLESSATREALTPAYAPPEAFRMEAPTPAGDIYSLGATLYALLQGRPPRFPESGAPSIAALMALLLQPVPDIPGVPPALTAVLRQALAYDPSARPGGAAALRDLLAGIDLSGPAALMHRSWPPVQAQPPAQAQPQPQPPGPYPYPAPGPYPAHTQPPAAPGQYPVWPPAPGPGLTSGPGLVSGPGQWGPQVHTTGPASHGYATLPPHRPQRRSRLVAVLATVTVVLAAVLATGLVFIFQGGNPLSAGGGVKRQTTVPSTSAGTKRSTSRPGGPLAPAQKNLLTPAGLSAVAGALRAASGENKVIELIVYEGYAKADIPSKAGRGLYDEYEYRDGRATRKGPGGTYDTADKLPDLSKIDWNVMRRLFARADAELGIAKPTMRYIIVDGGLIPELPTIRVYLVDGYGAGYLNADLKGRVRTMYPRRP